MPTQKPRITVSFEPELFEQILKRAKIERRNASNLCALLIELAMQDWTEPATKSDIKPIETPDQVQPPVKLD